MPERLPSPVGARRVKQTVLWTVCSQSGEQSMIATWARVSPKVTEGGLLIGWAGGQPYLPLLLRRGGTKCRRGCLPLWGKVSPQVTDGASFPFRGRGTACGGWGCRCRYASSVSLRLPPLKEGGYAQRTTLMPSAARHREVLQELFSKSGFFWLLFLHKKSNITTHSINGPPFTPVPTMTLPTKDKPHNPHRLWRLMQYI